MDKELIIDESNFSKYFRDCRISRPERGDVIARYMAKAEFIDGQMKCDIIDLLHNREKAFAATQVMRKLGCATQADSIKICKQIALDLSEGMSLKEVENKVYKYDIEMFFYAKKEHVPISDPHWSIIGIENLDEFLDSEGNRVRIQTKRLDPVIEESGQIIRNEETSEESNNL